MNYMKVSALHEKQDMKLHVCHIIYRCSNTFRQKVQLTEDCIFKLH